MNKPPFQKIENEPGLVKEISSKAILFTDNSALEAYRARRKKAAETEAKLDEINTLKQDVAEIKDLLRQLIGSKG
jgi:hypothetical protein